VADFRVRCSVDGDETISGSMSLEDAHDQQTSDVVALEADGYVVRYMQVVLEGPAGDVVVVDVEPV